jgi:hydrogenase nickel incorporation protein HypA/HybF
LAVGDFNRVQRKGDSVHEMSIAQSLLEIVLEAGQQHQLKQVKTIRLQVGEMAAVVPESLTFCFNLISENTIAAGAELEIENIPVVARCSDCGTLFEVENLSFICPQCQAPAIELVSGREMSLLNIEGETGDHDGSGESTGGAEHPAGQ